MSDDKIDSIDSRPEWQIEAEARERMSASLRFDARVNGEYQSPADVPTSDYLAAIRAEADKAKALFATTACEGYAENLARCTWTVERACPERKSSGCPRFIADWERSRRSCMQPDNATLFRGWGIPGAAAAQIARGEVEDTETLRIVESWWACKPRKRILVLLGGNDSGKTFAASVLLSRFGGRFVQAQEVANRCREENWLISLRTPGLVVVDEIGGEAGFANERAAVGRLICARIEAGVFTIATGNIGAEDLGGWYEERGSDGVTRLIDRVRKLGQIEGVEEVGLRRLA